MMATAPAPQVTAPVPELYETTLLLVLTESTLTVAGSANAPLVPDAVSCCRAGSQYRAALMAPPSSEDTSAASTLTLIRALEPNRKKFTVMPAVSCGTLFRPAVMIAAPFFRKVLMPVTLPAE